MVLEVAVEGFDAFMKAVEENKGKTVYAYFSGSVGEDGKSWCPDCVTAVPIVKDCLQFAADDAVYIYCGVGQRAFWKDQGNIFRTHEQLKLKSVPTLMRWGGKQRLEEGQCADKQLVQMLFED